MSISTNVYSAEQRAEQLETTTAAAAVHRMLSRLDSTSDKAAVTKTGDKRTFIVARDGRQYTFSRRIGEAMAVLKKSRGYFEMSGYHNAIDSIDRAVKDCAKQWNISSSAIWDKITRQFGLTGKAATEKARILYVESLYSTHPKLDDLLVYLLCSKTRKDDDEDIIACYLSL